MSIALAALAALAGTRVDGRGHGSLRPALAALAAGALVTLACCQLGKPTPQPAGELPEKIGRSGWARSPQVDVYAGMELYEYIDGAAEMYHKYAFVEVTVAEYRKGEGVITADLYRFADSDRAFGLYTTLRPDEPDTVAYGAEGFAFWPNLVFVSGPCLANVYGIDDSQETISGLRAISEAIEQSIGGSAGMPAAFDAFPGKDRLPFTEKIYAEAFLGHGFLTNVYAVDYSAGGNRFTLLATEDADSAKFRAWRGAVVPGDTSGIASGIAPGIEPGRVPEDLGEILVASDPYRGTIVAAPRAGKLLGMVGFRPELAAELSAWLR